MVGCVVDSEFKGNESERSTKIRPEENMKTSVRNAALLAEI
jgi:hypothetical protein